MISIKGQQFKTLKEALDAVREHEVIEIAGHVHEQLVISKPNITIKGGTIEYDLGAHEILADGLKRGTFRTYTVFVDADNVTFENVTVVNSNGFSQGQAIALMIDGNDFRAVNCRFSSYQDTLFLGPLPESEYEKGGFRGPMENRERVFRKAVFEKCLIEGSVDFIFGGGQGYFHDCEIRSRNIHKQINGYVCAPSTPADKPYGFIFDHCDFTSEEDMEDSVYLARPWRDYGKCLIVNSRFGKHIRKEGYSDWNKQHARESCEFKELNNSSAGTIERVDWLKQVSDEDLKFIDSLSKGGKIMRDVRKIIHNIGIVPVIALDKVEDAAPLAKALCDGGLPVAEVTYRTAAAHDAMIEMKKARPEMLIGAGTVLTKEQVDSALDAGAEFIVSPGLNPEIVRYCQSKGVPIFPGTANASDIEAALSLGLDFVKFFPAEPLGGLKMIKALAAPYNKVKFMPTGGIKEANCLEYLNDPVIEAIGGTWMIDKKAIEAGDFAKIEQLTRGAVNKMLGLYIKHVGVNEEGGNGLALAQQFAKFFGGQVRETSKGWFGSEFVEIMSEAKKKGRYGHIGLGVNNVDRAKRYFEAQGYQFDEESATYDAKGNMKFIYFKDEIGGFAIHLVL